MKTIISYNDYLNSNIFEIKQIINNFNFILIQDFHFSKINQIKEIFSEYHIYYNQKKKILRIAKKELITNKLYDYFMRR